VNAARAIRPNPLAAALSVTGTDNEVPVTLLGYQQQWIADQSALKIAEKSRRIGLTWAEAADNVLIASSEDGSNVFYISATQDMALEYIEACALWARAFDLAAGEIEEGIFYDSDASGDKQIKLYKIDFPKSGKRIVALSSRPANLRGKQGVVVIDEAAFAPDLAGLIKAAMAMLMWGDKVRIISTHDGDDNPFNELINEVRAGKRLGTVHKVTFADAVADGLFRRVCLRKGRPWSQEAEDAWVADVRKFYGADADEELDVIPARGGGTYLPLALIEARMVATDAEPVPIARMRWKLDFSLLPEPTRYAEVAEWCQEHLAPVLATLDRDRRHAFGEDFARVGDLTTITVLEEGKDLVNRPRLVVELGGCPFAQQRQILKFIVERLPRFHSGALDATGNGAELAEFAADTFGHSRIEQVKLSDMFYLENMPRFKAALEDATLADLPRDDQCRDDLRAIKKINGVPKLGPNKTQNADGKKVQRHGDFAISLFLGHYAATRDGMPGRCDGYQAMPRRVTSQPGMTATNDDYSGDSRRMF
jgi:phage FluMu gp28-like protein